MLRALAAFCQQLSNTGQGRSCVPAVQAGCRAGPVLLWGSLRNTSTPLTHLHPGLLPSITHWRAQPSSTPCVPRAQDCLSFPCQLGVRPRGRHPREQPRALCAAPQRQLHLKPLFCQTPEQPVPAEHSWLELQGKGQLSFEQSWHQGSICLKLLHGLFRKGRGS